jgi:predicted NBD/HSP70 family sugar kinase
VTPEAPRYAASAPLLRRLNERAVLDAIRAGAPISRAQISRRAGISKPTVSIALQTLVGAGLVREARDAPAGRTYGATYFEPVAEAALVLGFDLGARFLRGAVCDLAGVVRARQDVPQDGGDADAALDAIARLRRSLLDAAGLAAELVDGVVVGVPGVVEGRTGEVRLAANVPGLEGRAFGRELEERLGVARGVDDFVFLSVGTGMGAGIVLGGELHRGRHGAAGELDVALAGVAEEVDPAAPAVTGFAARLFAAGDRPTGLEPPLDPPAIFAAARRGDALAHEVVDEIARRIALHVAPVAAVADVELVVLGGGVGVNADLLLEPVRGLLSRWTPYAPRVEVSGLGDSAVLMGALAIGARAAAENVVVTRIGGSA